MKRIPAQWKVTLVDGAIFEIGPASLGFETCTPVKASGSQSLKTDERLNPLHAITSISNSRMPRTGI
jgi:hypothetical protein